MCDFANTENIIIYFLRKGNILMKNSQFDNNRSKSSVFSPRTDLACESIGAGRVEPRGTELRDFKVCGVSVSRLDVKTEAGEASTGRRRGTYITLYCPAIKYLEAEDEYNITEALSVMLRDLTEELCKQTVSSSTKVLVAGLGNRFITADAIGPRTADKVAVTGHMTNNKLFEAVGCSFISAVHPGVLGQTGIEAAAMIKGAAEYVKPDVIIAVDALASRSTDRLASTIQLSDTGIEPGSGIGNRRGAVNRETIGYPVIALGIPTVVDSATLVYDALEEAGMEESDELRQVLRNQRSFFVSPRDSDVICDCASDLLAAAINRAFFAEGL